MEKDARLFMFNIFNKYEGKRIGEYDYIDMYNYICYFIENNYLEIKDQIRCILILLNIKIKYTDLINYRNNKLLIKELNNDMLSYLSKIKKERISYKSLRRKIRHIKSVS